MSADTSRPVGADSACHKSCVPGRLRDLGRIVGESRASFSAVVARFVDDATHVAAATVARADAIVSWNFKHIVRVDKMRAYNQVNLQTGFGLLSIVSPQEVRFDEDE